MNTDVIYYLVTVCNIRSALPWEPISADTSSSNTQYILLFLGTAVSYLSAQELETAPLVKANNIVELLFGMICSYDMF